MLTYFPHLQHHNHVPSSIGDRLRVAYHAWASATHHLALIRVPVAR
jgi:hypothetical protein